MTPPARPEQLPADDAAHVRDEAADERDQAADERDEAGDQRDDAADWRDLVSDRRDEAALHRDAAADDRDTAASQREQELVDRSNDPARLDAARLSEAARRAAAMDRAYASRDRTAGVGERERAERDRTTASSDRNSGATERDQAGDDRSASARDRVDASLDGLTGAYVRGPGLLQLEREVVRAQRTGQPLSVAFLDVDRLKAVNDAGGHAAGDRLLVRVATALRGRLRPYDLVVRYGGDEFVCVLAGVGQAETEQRLAQVNTDLAPDGSVTVGVVTAAEQESSVALLQRADAALYAQRGVALPRPRS